MAWTIKENGNKKKAESKVFLEKLHEKLKIEEEKEKKRLEKEAKRREALEKFKLNSLMEQASVLSNDKSTFKRFTVLKKSKPASRDNDEECEIPLGGDASNFFLNTRTDYDTSSDEEIPTYDKRNQQKKIVEPKKTSNILKQEYFPSGTFYVKSKFSDQTTTTYGGTKKNKSNSRTNRKNRSKSAADCSSKSKSLQAPLWDFPDRHFLKSGVVEAPVPSVNPWDARQSKSKEINAMLPDDENEEEEMMRQALELSKLQALKEEKHRQLKEEYELQNLLLLSNPELLTEFGLNDEYGSTLISNRFTPEISATLYKNSPDDKEEHLNGKKTVQNKKSFSKPLLLSNPEHFKVFGPNNEYDSTPISSRSISGNNTTVYKTSTDNKQEFLESKGTVQNNKSFSNEQKKPVTFKGAKPKLSTIIDSFGGWGLKQVNQSAKLSNTSYSWDAKLSEKPSKFNPIKENPNADVKKEISHCSGERNKEQTSINLLNSKKYSRVKNLVTCHQKGSKHNNSEAHINKEEFAIVDEESKKQDLTNGKNTSCNNMNRDGAEIEGVEHLVSLKADSIECDNDLNTADIHFSKIFGEKMYISAENKSDLSRNIPLLYTSTAVSSGEADEMPLISHKNQSAFKDENSKSSFIYKELAVKDKTLDCDQTSNNAVQDTSVEDLLSVSNTGAINKIFDSSSVIPNLNEVHVHETSHTSVPHSLEENGPISNQEETDVPIKSNMPSFPTVPNFISSIQHETPSCPSYPAYTLPPETVNSCGMSGINPELAQTLLLNNSPFMKQWQALDSYYKLLSVRNFLPFYSQQMAMLSNGGNFNNDAPNVPEQNLCRNHAASANTSSGIQHINHAMPSSFMQNNEKKSSTYLAPPGIDASFIQPEPSPDYSELYDENPVWKQFLSSYDETVIPPPKPPTSLCDVPENFGTCKTYNHRANNFNSESKSESAFEIAQDCTASECVSERINVPTISMNNQNQMKNRDNHINGSSYQTRYIPNHSVKSSVVSVESEYSRWSDPEEDLDVDIPRRIIPWDDAIDGWGSECCPVLSVKSVSNYKDNKRPPNRQPTSQTCLERFNGQKKSSYR